MDGIVGAAINNSTARCHACEEGRGPNWAFIHTCHLVCAHIIVISFAWFSLLPGDGEVPETPEGWAWAQDHLGTRYIQRWHKYK